jgi:hypothetical protein
MPLDIKVIALPFEVIRPCLEPAVLPRIIQPNWPAHFTDSGTQKNISENHKMPD